MRERASEIVTFDLGPRTDIEIEHKLREEAEDERFTSHDRSLLREADADGVVRSGGGDDRYRHTLRAARLQQLRRFGLAADMATCRLRLCHVVAGGLAQKPGGSGSMWERVCTCDEILGVTSLIS